MEYSDTEQSSCESTLEEISFPNFEDPSFDPSQLFPSNGPSSPSYGSIPPQPRPPQPRPVNTMNSVPPFHPPQFVYFYLSFNSFDQATFICSQLTDLNAQFIAIPVQLFKSLRITHKKSQPFTGYLIYHH